MMGRKMRLVVVLLVLVLFINLPLVSALEIRNVRAEDVTDRSAVVMWETDEAASSFVSYGVEKTGLQTTGDAKPVVNHSLAVGGLSSSSTYYYKVKSGAVEADNGGALYNFETLVEDTTAPEVIAEIPELVGGETIDIKGETEEGAKVTLQVNGELRGQDTAEESEFEFLNVRLSTNAWNTLKITVEDQVGNANTTTYRVYADTAKPQLELEEIPEIALENRIVLKGTVSENVTLEVFVNNRSVLSKEVSTIEEEIALSEGDNLIEIVVTDFSGLETRVEKKVVLDTKPPTVRAELAKGNNYYQGRAVTDITGETKPGAKVYLYYFKRDVYEREPDFKHAVAVETANEEGKFTFSDVNLEYALSLQILEDLAPKQVPAGLEEVLIPPYEVIRQQQQVIYDVYLIAEDGQGRTAYWKQIVNLLTCYSADFGFHVDPLIEFQLPYRLDPTMMDQGRQIVSSIINLSYTGNGIPGENDPGFRIISTRVEKACTPGMLEEQGFEVSCKIFPNAPRLKPNPDKTAYFLQATLARSDELSKRGDDFWNDFKDRQLVFPMKMTVSYQEREAGGQWSTTKTQVSCFDLGYFVDIPLESDELIPDFLAEEGVYALNVTIDAIDTILPYLEKAMLVAGIGCGVSILGKMATRWYRLFIAKFEPVLTKAKKEEERCPSGDAQEKLLLKDTVKGENWGGDKPDDGEYLDDKCPQTAKAWEAEMYLQTGLRWICDRFFCHEAPAGWTEDKEEEQILAAKQKELACGTEGGRGIPLRELNDCEKHIKENPQEFSKTSLGDQSFKTMLINASGNTCYVDAKGNIYYVSMTKEELDRAEETRLWHLKPVGNRLLTGIGDLHKEKDLVAYKPEGARDYIVGLDDQCADVCKKREGYTEAGCREVDPKTLEPVNLSDGEYVADFTKDCFPGGENNVDVNTLQICVCQGEKIKGTIGDKAREAEPGEDWSYRQAQLFKETGGDEENCGGGKTGTCYSKLRYYQGRDLSAAFGADHMIDYVTGDESITEVNPFTQHIGAFQSVCISGIYNRLRLLQSTLVGMRNCLIEAKYTGLQNAGMCKEIFSQAVCGLIYKVIAYAAKGCLPIPFYNVDQKGNESVWGQGVEFGLGVIHDTLDSTMTDLTDEYGNAQLTDYFGTGVQGVTKNICLAALGYDWPYGVDFLMDAAYRTPMKTTALIVPAERELTSYNPIQGTAIYNYRVGASIFPGCKIRSYTVKLKCVGKEDIGRENVKCESFEDCPCLSVSDTTLDAQREWVLHRDFSGVKSAVYTSVPVPSPTAVDSPFRYDHVVMEIELDRNEDPTKCFDSQYIKGNTGVFYAPITDVSPKPLVACKIDPVKGNLYCPELKDFFGISGNAFLEAPYVQCYNERLGIWRDCKDLNNFIMGEAIKIKPHIFTDGKKQCLHVSLTGFKTRVYPIPEDVGPSLRPEYVLGSVTEELLGISAGDNLVTMDSQNANCAPGNLGTYGAVSPGLVTFSYVQSGSGYKLMVEPGVEVEGNYRIVDELNVRYLSLEGRTELTVKEIANAIFRVRGFRRSNILNNPSASQGSCKYEARQGGVARDVSGGARDLTLTVELKYPGEGGDCSAFTTGKKVDSALGLTRYSTPLKIQKEVSLEAAGALSELHQEWLKKQYRLLLDKAVFRINPGVEGDTQEAIAYYYVVAANIMIWKTEGDPAYKTEALNWINLFKADKFDTTATGSDEYVKIKKYFETMEPRLK